MTNNPTPPDLTPAELRELADAICSEFDSSDFDTNIAANELRAYANLKERAGSAVTDSLVDRFVVEFDAVYGEGSKHEAAKIALTAVLPDLVAAREAVASEPVAWRWKSRRRRPDREYEITTSRAVADDVASGPATVEPLYTAPQKPPAVDRYAWQPIETAPRDGTMVLVCVDHPNLYLPRAGVWASYHPNAKGKAEWRTASICGDKLYPTHWMPLPPPPEIEKEQGHG